MSMFRKPSEKKVGLKVLIYGATGVGKSVFGMSFPKLYALDAEAGLSHYEAHPVFGKNLLGIVNTQDFNELQEALDELMDVDVEDVNTFVVDSETKVYQNLVDATLQVEEKRARRAGRDVMDASVSQRGWGRIKNLAERLQNLKIDLSARGIHVISVAQAKDIKQKVGDNFVVVGQEPDMKKQAGFDYDIVLHMFTEKDENGAISRKAEVKKDRTGVTQEGDIVENPSYEIWRAYYEGKKGADLIQSNLAGDTEKSMSAIEEEIIQEEKVVADRLKEAMSKSDEHKAKALELIKKAKIANPLAPKDNAELKKLEDIVKVIEAM